MHGAGCHRGPSLSRPPPPFVSFPPLCPPPGALCGSRGRSVRAEHEGPAGRPPWAAAVAGSRRPPPAPPQPRPRAPEALPGGQRAAGASQGGGHGLGPLPLHHPGLLCGHLLLAVVTGSGLEAQEELRGGLDIPPCPPK